MKKRTVWWLIVLLLVTSLSVAGGSQGEELKMTVLNPLGYAPAIRQIPMAPRLDVLDGKTLYLVNVKFPLTDQFFVEMQKLLAQKYPRVNWVLKDKAGTYFDDDPQLWAEIKQKGDGVIMGVGH